MSDLVVVVADGGIEQAIRGILSRPHAVGIRELAGVEYPKLHKMDEGTYSAGHELAALYSDTHEHALVIFDLAWEGRPVDTASKMMEHVEENLQKTWGSRARCVVIDPELESWVWSGSPHVADSLGWNSISELRHWLEQNRLWAGDSVKPSDPKAAYLRAIREKKIPKSNAIFYKLASKVSFQRCIDPAFLRLTSTLREWFPRA